MFFDHIDLVPLTKHPQIKRMLREADSIGCVLDYVPFEQEGTTEFALHRQRALDAMKILQRSSEIFARKQKRDQYFKVVLDETSLHGQSMEATQFWGNDDAETKWKDGVGFGPIVDGYKTAFFQPPHGLALSLDEQIELFNQLNLQLWNGDLSDCSIYSWSTDWSNYFDGGHEWWGAFWWTVYSPQTRLLSVIGASATD